MHLLYISKYRTCHQFSYAWFGGVDFILFFCFVFPLLFSSRMLTTTPTTLLHSFSPLFHNYDYLFHFNSKDTYTIAWLTLRFLSNAPIFLVIIKIKELFFPCGSVLIIILNFSDLNCSQFFPWKFNPRKKCKKKRKNKAHMWLIGRLLSISTSLTRYSYSIFFVVVHYYFRKRG